MNTTRKLAINKQLKPHNKPFNSQKSNTFKTMKNSSPTKPQYQTPNSQKLD